jgi:16S rRNA (adenine1518-N6/adenine1519-N6)-dimethyltransferase
MPAFVSLIRLGFSQRRKTLRNSLSSGWGREKTERVLAAAGIPEKARAEELGLGEFLGIYQESRE